MTNPTKYDKLVTRIFWFALPLIISLLTYLVITTFVVKEAVTKVATKNEATVELQNKMWELIQKNNEILNKKADQDINEKEHQQIMVKLDKVEEQVTKIYGRKFNYGENMGTKINDTIYFLPLKDMSFVSDTNNLKWDGN